MTKALLTLSASLFLFVACDVSDGEEPPNSNTDNGISGAIENADFTPNDESEFKLFVAGGSEKEWSSEAFTLAGQTTFTSCRLDDTMLFIADGTYIYDGGIVLCGAEDNEQSRTGTWEVDYESRTMTFDAGTSFEEEADVIGLSEDEIRLQGSYMMMEIRGLYIASN